MGAQGSSWGSFFYKRGEFFGGDISDISASQTTNSVSSRQAKKKERAKDMRLSAPVRNQYFQ